MNIGTRCIRSAARSGPGLDSRAGSAGLVCFISSVTPVCPVCIHAVSTGKGMTVGGSSCNRSVCSCNLPGGCNMAHPFLSANGPLNDGHCGGMRGNVGRVGNSTFTSVGVAS